MKSEEEDVIGRGVCTNLSVSSIPASATDRLTTSFIMYACFNVDNECSVSDTEGDTYKN